MRLRDHSQGSPVEGQREACGEKRSWFVKDLENFIQKVEKILKEHKKYKFEAYTFVMAALHHTVTKLAQPRHVTGQELLMGIREYALAQYGPMTRTVLNYWGLHKTQDFSKIVFALVDASILRKQPEDKLEDFKDVYDFREAFDRAEKFPDEP